MHVRLHLQSFYQHHAFSFFGLRLLFLPKSWPKPYPKFGFCFKLWDLPLHTMHTIKTVFVISLVFPCSDAVIDVIGSALLHQQLHAVGYYEFSYMLLYSLLITMSLSLTFLVKSLSEIFLSENTTRSEMGEYSLSSSQ